MYQLVLPKIPGYDFWSLKLPGGSRCLIHIPVDPRPVPSIYLCAQYFPIPRYTLSTWGFTYMDIFWIPQLTKVRSGVYLHMCTRWHRYISITPETFVWFPARALCNLGSGPAQVEHPQGAQVYSNAGADKPWSPSEPLDHQWQWLSAFIYDVMWMCYADWLLRVHVESKGYFLLD